MPKYDIVVIWTSATSGTQAQRFDIAAETTFAATSEARRRVVEAGDCTTINDITWRLNDGVAESECRA